MFLSNFWIKICVNTTKANGGERVTIYVQETGSDTWHWCMNCSKFPTSITKTRTTKPTENLCEECEAKEKNGNCF